MSEDKKKTPLKWETAKLRPFGGFVDQLKDLRKLVAEERDRVADELEKKKPSEED